MSFLNKGGAIHNKRAVSIREEEVDGAKRAIIRILATNKEPDFFGTMMMDSSLTNYLKNAKEDNISFLDSHIIRNTGYGWSVGGERINDDLFVDMAVLLEDEWSGMTYRSAKRLIYALRHRPFDVSIGFADERMNCSICNHEMFTSECEHWLHEEYTIGGQRVVAIGEIEDAILTEVSLVYDGATPGATTEIPEDFRSKVVEKADTLIRAGRATRQQLTDMCTRLRIPIIEPSGGDSDPPADPQPPQRQTRRRSMAKNAEALQSKVDDLEEQVEDLTEEVSELRESKSTLREQNRKLKTENKGLKEAQAQIEEIETELRSVCAEEKKGLLEKSDDEDVSGEMTDYREKIGDMRYKQLRGELKDLAKQRDIVIAIESKNDDEPDPDDADPVTGDDKDKIKVHQPFAVRFRSQM